MPTSDLSTFLQQGLSTGGVMAPTSTAAPVSTQASGASAGNPSAAIDAGVSNQGAAALKFPSDTARYYTLLRHTPWTGYRNSLSQVGTSASGGQMIVLPIPISLEDQNEENYDEYPYGMLAGAAVNLGIGSGAGLLGTAAAVTVAQGIEAAGFNQLVEAGRAPAALGGYSPNAFATILFRSPKYKRPRLTFRLAPRDHTESQSIRSIIADLNNAMAPSYVPQTAGVLFSFPDVFDIQFVPNSGWLYKFKPCVLETAHFDYGGRGAIAFYGGSDYGAPESVTMDLQFIELEYWMKKDFVTNNSGQSGYHANSDNPNHDAATGTVTGATNALGNAFGDPTLGTDIANQFNKLTGG